MRRTDRRRASANGSRDTANRFYIDGIEVMDYDAMTYSFSPSVDSLAEFKVQTSTYSAEYGGAPGGQINMITKSGTNRLSWHALGIQPQRPAHAELRCDRGQERHVAAAEPQPVRRQLRRTGLDSEALQRSDKTFFFFNWESGYAAQGASSAFRIVPTAAMRNGDLSGLLDARTRQPIVLKDPLNIGIVGNVDSEIGAEQGGAGVPELRAAAQCEQRVVQFRDDCRERYFHSRRTSWAGSIGRCPAKTSSPAATCSTTPTKREHRSGATTSATTWGVRRTSRFPGRGSSARR